MVNAVKQMPAGRQGWQGKHVILMYYLIIPVVSEISRDDYFSC